MKTKIGAANISDNYSAKLLSLLATNPTEYTKIFYFGQVIINDDPNNLNRVKVRIPIIDDIFYKDVSQNQGNNSLPWCLPINSRFINTPEANSIVIVILSDPKMPHFGRIYLDAITDLSTTDLFEKLTPEEKSLSNWLNAENSVETIIPKPQEDKKNDVANKIKSKIGIRGKGKNKLEFTDINTLLVQNHKDRTKESLLNLTTDIQLESSNDINIISKKGKNKKYHPVFDETLFNYLDKQNRMIQKIVTLLNTVPAIATTGPCTAAPNASQLISEFTLLKKELVKLKQIGFSEKIFIN